MRCQHFDQVASPIPASWSVRLERLQPYAGRQAHSQATLVGSMWSARHTARHNPKRQTQRYLPEQQQYSTKRPLANGREIRITSEHIRKEAPAAQMQMLRRLAD